MAESQLRVLAGQIRSKVDEAITTIKEKASSTPIDPDNDQAGHSHEHSQDQQDHPFNIDPTVGTSSCSPESTHPNESTRTADIIDSVMSTLFGVCTGNTGQNNNNHNHNGYCPNLNGMNLSEMEKKHIMDSMQRRHKMNTNHNSNNGGRPGKKKTASHPFSLRPYGCGASPSAKSKDIQQLQNDDDKDEAFYAQFYQDDHGRAARAFLAARERERQEGQLHRQQLQSLHQSAREEAHQRNSHHHARVTSQQQQQYTSSTHLHTPQHKERIRVGNNGYRLCEVTSPPYGSNSHNLNTSGSGSGGCASYDDGDGMSYNYDDGISALSAHTLEEMAKAEMILQRRRGIPKEQGFDIDLDMDMGVHSEDAEEEDCGGGGRGGGPDQCNDRNKQDKSSSNEFDKGPPSPASTFESSNASKDETELMTYRIEDVVNEEQQLHRQQQQQTSGSGSGSVHNSTSTLEHYPVQMARPPMTTTTDRGGGGHAHAHGGPVSSMSSSKSNASGEWRKQEQKYWMQVVDNDNNKHGSSRESVPKPPREHHPHDTPLSSLRSSGISTSGSSTPSSSSTKKKRTKPKPRKTKLFGRRKKYMECEEEGGDEAAVYEI